MKIKVNGTQVNRLKAYNQKGFKYNNSARSKISFEVSSKKRNPTVPDCIVYKLFTIYNCIRVNSKNLTILNNGIFQRTKQF